MASNTMSGTSAPASSSLSTSVLYSHAVSRSTELLSCARTALKIAKSEYAASNNNTSLTITAPWYISLDPSYLELHDIRTISTITANDSTGECVATLLEDGLSLLRSMEQSLAKLKSLVRRRGHTNDPTYEISNQVQNFEADAKELASLVISLTSTTSTSTTRANTKHKQQCRHYELVATWLQSVASEQTNRLKEILIVRGTVLADQAQRRKLLQPGAAAAAAAADPANGNPANGNRGGQPLTTSATTTTGAAARNLTRKPNKQRQIPSGLQHMNSPLFPNNRVRGSSSSNGRVGGAVPTNNSQAATMSNSTIAPSIVPPNGPSASVNGSTIPCNKTLSHATSSSAASPYSASHDPSVSNPNASSTTSGYSFYGGYSAGSGGAHGGGGYGGDRYGGGGEGFTGMRQRRAGAQNASYSNTHTNDDKDSNEEEDDAKKQRAQLQTRIQDRQSASRLESAQQAEATLATLGTIFGKMSNMIVSQGENLERIEDDVEAAYGFVEQGQEEITKLYSLKKGNRGLILKTFGILIFFILFMKLY